MTTPQPDLMATAAQLKCTMSDLESRIRAWWKRDGLGYTSSIHMTGSGCIEVDFNCSPYSEIEERIYEEDSALPLPERRAQVIRQFEERGFVLRDEPGSDVVLMDCDKTTATLDQLVLGTFPTAVVVSRVLRGSRTGAITVSSMRVFIRELDEVFALPKPPTGTP